MSGCAVIWRRVRKFSKTRCRSRQYTITKGDRRYRGSRLDFAVVSGERDFERDARPVLRWLPPAHDSAAVLQRILSHLGEKPGVIFLSVQDDFTSASAPLSFLIFRLIF